MYGKIFDSDPPVFNLNIIFEYLKKKKYKISIFSKDIVVR